MAGLEPSSGLRSIIRVLLVVAISILFLGVLVGATMGLTEFLVDLSINEVTQPDPVNNTTTTTDSVAPPILG